MSYTYGKGPGDKPTKKYEPIEPESEPKEGEEPGWEQPGSDDH